MATPGEVGGHWHWTLVLKARGVPFRVTGLGKSKKILVPPISKERAEREILLYEEEIRQGKSIASPIPDNPAAWLSLTVPLLLIALHLQLPEAIRKLGWLDARLFKQGQWWRAATALTLHGDTMHLMGNAAIGTVIIYKLCRSLGFGASLFLLVLCGAIANSANVFTSGPYHVSLGASTAIFAAVGVLASLAVQRRRDPAWRKLVIPIGAGAALLSMLGGPGGNTDYGAHLWGFFIGLLGGGVTAFIISRKGLPGLNTGFALGAVGALAVAAAWYMALA